MTPSRYFFIWLSAFLGITAVNLLQTLFISPDDIPLLIGSFGASAVLLYAAPQSPLAQPRNLIGGHVLSAVVGVSCFYLLGDSWFAASCAVATAITAMQLTNTLHPPGGATSLIAVIGTQKIHALGYWYVLCPVLTGALLMLFVAIATKKLRQ